MTPDGRLAVFASRDDTPKVWNPASGWELHMLTGHLDWVLAVAVTSDDLRWAAPYSTGFLARAGENSSSDNRSAAPSAFGPETRTDVNPQERFIICIAFGSQPRVRGCREPPVQVLIESDRHRAGKASDLASLQLRNQVRLRLAE